MCDIPNAVKPPWNDQILVAAESLRVELFQDPNENEITSLRFKQLLRASLGDNHHVSQTDVGNYLRNWFSNEGGNKFYKTKEKQAKKDGYITYYKNEPKKVKEKSHSKETLIETKKEETKTETKPEQRKEPVSAIASEDKETIKKALETDDEDSLMMIVTRMMAKKLGYDLVKKKKK